MGGQPQAASAATGQIIQYGSSSSSSYTKLNKSANNIQSQISTQSQNNQMLAPLASVRRKEQQAPSSSSLSQQLINSFAKVNNMSPNNKKILQQLVKQQFGTNPSQGSSAGIPLSVQANSAGGAVTLLHHEQQHDLMNQNSKRGSAHAAAAIITSSKAATITNNHHHQVSSSSKDNKTPGKSAANTYRKESAPLARNNDHSLELSPINVMGGGNDHRKK